MSQTNSRCSHHISVCTKPVQHTPYFTLYHSQPRDTNLTCFTLRQKAFVAKFLFTYLILFAIGKLFFFFDQSLPPVNFNYLFSFFAAHKIHGMDDRGVCVCVCVCVVCVCGVRSSSWGPRCWARAGRSGPPVGRSGQGLGSAETGAARRFEREAQCARGRGGVCGGRRRSKSSSSSVR